MSILYPPTKFPMGVEEFRNPNSLFQSTWSLNPDYTNLIFLSRYDTNPDNASPVTAGDADDNDEHIVGLQAATLGVINKIEAYFFTIAASGQANMTGKLYIGGSLAGSVAIPCTGSYEWGIITLTTGWTKSQLQTGFRIGLQASSSIAKLGQCQWHQGYVKLSGR